MERLVPDGSARRLQHVLVCGSGLAGQMMVAALSRQAPPNLQITWLKVAGSDSRDMLYGCVAPPSAYDFNLAAGLDEPSVVLDSNTAFSFGTRYSDWGAGRRAWIQAFLAPFPVLEGVLLYHYFLQRGLTDISPFLVSAEAARQGVFAHPPEDERHPLSRAEYGYQFDPAAYGALFEQRAGRSVATFVSDIAGVERDGDDISAVHLTDGRSLAADLYIDCTGPDARLAPPAGKSAGSRSLRFAASRGVAADLGPPVRTVTAGAFGWSAETPVDGADLRLTVYAADSEDQALQAHGRAPSAGGDFVTGYRARAWTGNCVAIGHAAGVVEPVTPAPFMLLQRDIERLLSLLPVSVQMAVESREFNRQFSDDYRHADMFNRALFEAAGAPASSYWQEAAAAPRDERLVAKIEQFESRGLHVAYDLEPFGLEDWIIMHFGMGRRAQRYDRVADHVAREKIDPYLARLQNDIAQTVRSMPRHGVYRQGLAKFLKQQSTRVS